MDPRSMKDHVQEVQLQSDWPVRLATFDYFLTVSFRHGAEIETITCLISLLVLRNYLATFIASICKLYSVSSEPLSTKVRAMCSAAQKMMCTAQTGHKKGGAPPTQR